MPFVPGGFELSDYDNCDNPFNADRHEVVTKFVATRGPKTISGEWPARTRQPTSATSALPNTRTGCGAADRGMLRQKGAGAELCGSGHSIRRLLNAASGCRGQVLRYHKGLQHALAVQ